MNKNNSLVAWGWIGSIGSLILAMGIGDSAGGSVLNAIGILGFWVFAIWAIVILFKTADKKLAEEVDLTK